MIKYMFWATGLLLCGLLDSSLYSSDYSYYDNNKKYTDLLDVCNKQLADAIKRNKEINDSFLELQKKLKSMQKSAKELDDHLCRPLVDVSFRNDAYYKKKNSFYYYDRREIALNMMAFIGAAVLMHELWSRCMAQ